MVDILQTALPIFSAAVLRSLGGWLENAMKDGKIELFEWGQLGATIFRVGVMSLGGIYGLDLTPIAAAGSALVLDFILKALRSKAKKEVG